MSMTLLEYYKKYLSEDIEKVEEVYCSMNLTDDTSGTEFYNRVTYSDGKQEYYFATFEYYHSVDRPIDFPKEWLEIAEIADNSDLELPDDTSGILSGKGW